MALQLGSLRTALIEAGASEEKADRAAEEVAGYENRLTGIEVKIERLDGRVTLVQWMLGGLYAVAVPIIWLLVRIAIKIGTLP